MSNLVSKLHTYTTIVKSFFKMDSIFPAIIAFFLMFIFFRFVFAFYIRILYPIKQNFKKKNESGYIVLDNGNFEHREVVETLIKRILQHGEEVHHINGVKWDNRKSNLALMRREEHQRWHKKLEWMWEKKMRPSIRWQRNNLKNDFGATLF